VSFFCLLPLLAAACLEGVPNRDSVGLFRVLGLEWGGH
jgi:hypothetical protein